MRKTESTPASNGTTLRPSPDAIRGKYYNRLAEGTNLVILDPALLPDFPDSKSVNDALHAFLSLSPYQRTTALEQSHRRPDHFELPATDYDPRTGQTAK